MQQLLSLITYSLFPLKATHDFWPSISQVVSAFLPERYVGRMAMALISFPRIMDGIMYHQFFATRNLLLCQKLWYRSLIRLNSFFLIVHLLLFYSLMYISSAENAGELFTKKFCSVMLFL